MVSLNDHILGLVRTHGLKPLVEALARACCEQAGFVHVQPDSLALEGIDWEVDAETVQSIIPRLRND